MATRHRTWGQATWFVLFAVVRPGGLSPRCVFPLRFLLCFVWLVSSLTSPARANDEFFQRKIRPVLAGTCFRCHGGERVAGKLRVDSRDHLLKGGASGPAIVPGSPESSLLIRALRHAEGVVAMPPGKRLANTGVQAF